MWLFITKEMNDDYGMIYTFWRRFDGDEWCLGRANEKIQDEGTEDERRWFEGYFDTKAIAFDDDVDLLRVLARRGQRQDEIVIDELKGA